MSSASILRPKSLFERSTEAVGIFNKTVKSLEQVNKEASTQVEETNRQINYLTSKKDELVNLQKNNSSIIEKINKILS